MFGFPKTQPPMKKPKTTRKKAKTNRPEPAVIRVAVADARKPMLIGLAQMVNALPGYRADVLKKGVAEA